jgi:glycosyltransferase involved in cell wall biosynthesis
MGNDVLVSCIMPTYNRRAFVPRAIEYFLRQDYPRKELLILDDGEETVGDLVPADERIRYLRLQQRLTLGAKLNVGCERVRGEIIAEWDDDDWYPSDRLSTQVTALCQAGTDLCGTNRLLFYELAANRVWRYAYPPSWRAWLAGSSHCFRRELWLRQRFPDVTVGVDARFVWSIDPARLTVLPHANLLVALIHPRNCAPKRTDGPCWQPVPVEEVQQLLADDWDFYQRVPLEGVPQLRRQANGHVQTPTHLAAAMAPTPTAVMPTDGGTASIGAARTVQAAGTRKSEGGAEPRPLRNVHACLIHESQECVIDLVRNLHYLDPDSTILLYNGGQDSRLLDQRFPFERYNAVVHPRPQVQTWGRLHGFALDCMTFALENLTFDTLTIVDSDQLGLRGGYAHYLTAMLPERDGLGLLGNVAAPQPPTTRVGPAAAAFRELALWQPFLRRFPEGEARFAHWSFWPSTVFTADAARDLTHLFATDAQLQWLMHVSRIWATEEVILPTLVALLGYTVAANPCSYDYVQYRVPYTVRQMDVALSRPDVFWAHPVARRYDDPLRRHIRTRLEHYTRPPAQGGALMAEAHAETPGLLLTLPILTRMRAVEGWLDDDEADLLIASTARALATLDAGAVVEVGSYLGRSTVALGSVVRTVRPTARVYAVDPHDGRVGALDQGIQQTRPTLDGFRHNIASAGLSDFVVTIQQHSFDVAWDQPIALLLIDGLHDYANVARDFHHFEPYVVEHGYVAFHDYADYYPGVKAFVNELLQTGGYRAIHCAASLMVVQKQPAAS